VNSVFYFVKNLGARVVENYNLDEGTVHNESVSGQLTAMRNGEEILLPALRFTDETAKYGFLFALFDHNNHFTEFVNIRVNKGLIGQSAIIPDTCYLGAQFNSEHNLADSGDMQFSEVNDNPLGPSYRGVGKALFSQGTTVSELQDIECYLRFE
jgi:hypothetical protein